MRKIILNLDESGNMGRQGRFFTIACIETFNTKPLRNVMKKAVLKTKKEFPEFLNCNEIKASDSSPIIKEYFLRKIATKDVNVRYIVADLPHVKKSLIDDENLLYNFMLKFLVLPIAKQDNLDCIEINLDKRTIKVKSTNSFEDYIKIKINYELGLDIDINVKYVESHNSYAIQAADFIANTINNYYESGNNNLYNVIKPIICHREQFPVSMFGKELRKVVQIK